MVSSDGWMLASLGCLFALLTNDVAADDVATLLGV
jgi:hypothetical protein